MLRYALADDTCLLELDHICLSGYGLLFFCVVSEVAAHFTTWK
uniref:Uncharacterized protein n=1 Tax=Arundo donax TaxID=35708 RepID=A0A0A9C525_ARUDO